jgi:multisubunit Na+/H+ antiporter MnhE subunit
LKLDAGKYTLVATYDHEDYVLSAVTVNFEVYKANPTISVADVEVGYNDSIIVNIETNVPSTYTIEIGDYKTVKFINGSRSVEIENTFEPGTYTIKVTSQERVNYISNSTEATLKVNKNLPLFALSVSN